MRRNTTAILAQDDFDVEYTPTISLGRYLLVGLAGVLIGYAIRLLVKVLSTVPPPALAPTPAGSAGPVTTFVTRHYYAVDCAVTLTLGLLVLIFFIKDGHPPDAGIQWYGALGIGVGLGLLTNSELVTKLPR